MTLVERLDHMISNQISKTPKMLQTADGQAASYGVYAEFESYTSWKILDTIMRSVKIEISLRFGMPENPSAPKISSDVEVGNRGELEELLKLVCLKVFVILAVSSVLYTYIFDPLYLSEAHTDYVLQAVNHGTASVHEVTFFRGAGVTPLVTFYEPDEAEAYENRFGSEARHWTDALKNETELVLEVHKFITPKLTQSFMGYFATPMGAGQMWTHYDDEEEGDGAEY